MGEEDAVETGSVKAKRKSKKSSDDKKARKSNKAKKDKRRSKAVAASQCSASDEEIMESPKRAMKKRESSFRKFQEGEYLPDVGGSSPGVVSRKKLDGEKVKKKAKAKDKKSGKKRKSKASKHKDDPKSGDECQTKEAETIAVDDAEPERSTRDLLPPNGKEDGAESVISSSLNVGDEATGSSKSLNVGDEVMVSSKSLNVGDEVMVSSKSLNVGHEGIVSNKSLNVGEESPKHSAKVFRKKLEKVDRMLQETDASSEKYKKLQIKQQEYIHSLQEMGETVEIGSAAETEGGGGDGETGAASTADRDENDQRHNEIIGQVGEMRLNDDVDANYEDIGEIGEMGLNDDDEEYGFMDLIDEEGEMGLNDGDDDDRDHAKSRSSSSLSNPTWSRSFRAEVEKNNRRQASLGRHQQRKNSTRKSDRNHSIKKRTRGVRQALNAGENFEVPVFKKTKEEKEFLKESLKGDFVFQNLEKKSYRLFIDAFELVDYRKGENIVMEGDVGDYFYVVAEGRVKFFINDKIIGRGERGNTFGEAALLYTAPRSSTVTAAEDTTLYRVDQQTFKFITQKSAQDVRQQKLELLRNVDFLDDLLNDDLQRLCDLMVPRVVTKGEYLYKKDVEADAFYVLQSGSMKATDIVVGDATFEDIIIQPGDYFGQNALARDSPRENSVVAEEESIVYGIDRTTFDKVLGSFYNVILKTNDRQLLGHIQVIKDLGLDSFQLISLAEQVMEVQFIEGEEIFTEGEDIEPALYLIRDGTVNISVGHGADAKTVQEDVYFGDDVLLSQEEVVPARYTVTALDDTICGCLTVKACRLVLDLQASDNTTSSTSPAELSLASSATMQRRAELEASFENDILTVEELEKIRIVGEGEYGKVWLTKCADLDEVLALKIQQLEQDGESYYDNIKREVATIGCLHHPYIVGLINSKFTGNECFMVMDFISGGELWSVVHREYPDGRWESGISAADAKFYSLIIADTISYMHRRNILFRDLKPENVMIDSDGYPNIIDFGFAKVCEEKAFTFCGTPNYVAPEIVLNAGHGVGVDHWALGVMIYEMISGENPFWYDGIDTMTLYEIIVKDEPYPLEKEHADPVVEHLIDGLLEKDPSQRMGVLAGKDKDILFHEWYDGLDLQSLRHKKVKAPWLPPKPEIGY